MSNLFSRLFGASPGMPGDYSPDDDYLDGHARSEERTGDGPLGLAAIPAPLTGGRIAWRTILNGIPNVVFTSGWETRGAPVMNPIGVLNHWTASKPTTARPTPSLQLCINGRDAIPGPLCHLLYGLDGTINVIAGGRANHAGVGNQALLTRIRQGLPPAGSARALHLPNTGGSGGALIGFEIENDGTKPFTLAQLASIKRVQAALIAHLHFNPAQAGSWHHRAWTDRKIDFDDAKAAQIYALAKTA